MDGPKKLKNLAKSGLFAGFFLLVLPARATHAEIIHLKLGPPVLGILYEETKEYALIKTPYGPQMIPQVQIKHIDYTPLNTITVMVILKAASPPAGGGRPDAGNVLPPLDIPPRPGVATRIEGRIKSLHSNGITLISDTGKTEFYEYDRIDTVKILADPEKNPSIWSSPFG